MGSWPRTSPACLMTPHEVESMQDLSPSAQHSTSCWGPPDNTQACQCQAHCLDRAFVIPRTPALTAPTSQGRRALSRDCDNSTS